MLMKNGCRIEIELLKPDICQYFLTRLAARVAGVDDDAGLRDGGVRREVAFTLNSLAKVEGHLVEADDRREAVDGVEVDDVQI